MSLLFVPKIGIANYRIKNIRNTTIMPIGRQNNFWAKTFCQIIQIFKSQLHIKSFYYY
jgi:hypothetical protein